MLADLGEKAAKELFAGWVNNLAQAPFAGDRPIITAVANGECTFGIVNSYYVGEALQKTPNLPVQMKLLTDSAGGAHTNGSLIAIAAQSQQAELAQAFINTAFEDSHLLRNGAAHFDYPAKLSLPAPSYLPKAWHHPKLSPIKWNTIMRNLPNVRALFESANYR